MARSGSGLSKSLILKGLQCQKALWLAKHPPAFELPPQPDLQAKFAAGNEVGLLAQQLFPGGIEVPYDGLSFPAQLARTKELIENGTDIIYEASFSFSAIFVKADILVRDGDHSDSWQIYEVKMGTGVKPVNLDDVAVQQYVLNGCGLSVSRSFLVHIDNSYTRQGAIEVDKLFHAEDISAKVAARRAVARSRLLSESVVAMSQARELSMAALDQESSTSRRPRPAALESPAASMCSSCRRPATGLMKSTMKWLAIFSNSSEGGSWPTKLVRMIIARSSSTNR